MQTKMLQTKNGQIAVTFAWSKLSQHNVLCRVTSHATLHQTKSTPQHFISRHIAQHQTNPL